MARRGLHRLIRHRGPRRKAVALGVLGTTVVLGLAATMVPLLADDDLSIPVAADTTASMVSQDGDNSVKTTLATCPVPCDGNPRGGREAVLAFSVTSLPANVVNVRAVLRVYAWQAFDATVTAHASRLDARAARPVPAPVGAALARVTGVSKGFNEWDVSGLVTGNGTWTVSLAQSGLATRIYWAAAENRNPDLRPRLTISYGPGARPTPASPSAAPTPTPTRVPVPPSASPSVSPTPARPSPSPSATPTPTPPAAGDGGCGAVSDKLVPSCGAWWGMYSPTNPATWDHGRAITDVEAQVGRTFDIVHRYHDFSNTGSNGAFPDVYQRQQMREGRLMFSPGRAGSSPRARS